MVRLVTQAVLNVGAGMHSVAYVNLMKNGHDKTPQAHVLCHDRPSLPYLRVFQQPPYIVEATAPDWGRVDRRIRRCPKTRRMYDCKCRVTGAHNRNAPNRLLCTMAEKGDRQSAASGALRARLGDATGDDRTIGGIRGIKASRLERGSIRLSKILTNWPAAGAHLQQRAFYIHLPAALMQQPTPPCSP